MNAWWALAAAGLAAAGAAEAPRTGGSSTWLFVVSVLEFQDAASFVPFPKEGRRDAELVRLFRESRGVPESNVVWLRDSEATLPAIRAALRGQLAKTRPGDLLFLYYAGHGTRRPPGVTSFVPYDGRGADDGEASGWPVPEIVADIESRFRGDRAILAADCCHSGGLCREAAAAGRRVSYACLASAQSSSPSTGEWTFTDALLEGLTGSAAVDADADKAVEFGELAAYVEREMAYHDEQLSAAEATGRFHAGTKLADVGGDARPPRRVSVRWKDGKSYPATVLGACGGGKLRVRYRGCSAEHDERVPEADAPDYRPPARRWKDGETVFVEWEKSWYRATVRGYRLGMHRVRYDGYDAYWDEWAAPGRIRSESPCGPPPCRP